MLGAVSLLASPAIWRACTRHLQPCLALAAAVLAGSAHRSPRSGSSIYNTFALYLLRFIRPGELADSQVPFLSRPFTPSSSPDPTSLIAPAFMGTALTFAAAR